MGRKLIKFVSVIILAAAVGLWLFLMPNGPGYEGQISCVVASGGKSAIVACDVSTGQFSVLKELDRPPEQVEYAIINDKGDLIAYTEWNEQQNEQYLVIEGNTHWKHFAASLGHERIEPSATVS